MRRADEVDAKKNFYIKSCIFVDIPPSFCAYATLPVDIDAADPEAVGKWITKQLTAFLANITNTSPPFQQEANTRYCPEPYSVGVERFNTNYAEIIF